MKLLEIVERIPELDRVYRTLLLELISVAPGPFKKDDVYYFQGKTPHLTYSASGDGKPWSNSTYCLAVGAHYINLKSNPSLKFRITFKQPLPETLAKESQVGEVNQKIQTFLKDFPQMRQTEVVHGQDRTDEVMFSNWEFILLF